jgi:hypothetical protein
MPPFPTRRSWPPSTPAPPRLSTLARDITRSRVATPGAGFSGCTSCSLPSSDVANTCCKHMFLSVSYACCKCSCGCCKSRSRCCICYNGYTHMLQVSVPNVSAVLDRCCMCLIWVLYMFHTYVASVSFQCCICFHTYVTSVLSRCCICFAMTTHVFPSCFRHMLQVFQLFRTYVTNVSFRYCKSRSGVAHDAVDPICNRCLLQLLGLTTSAWVWRGCEKQRGRQCGCRSRRSKCGT